jgi:hypothetical protein
MANLDQFQILKGDAIKSPAISGYKEVVVSANITGTYNVDFSTANVFELTVTGNVTLSFTNPALAGFMSNAVIILKQNGTGGYTVTLPTVKWPGGIAPTQTTTANAVDVYAFFTTDGGTTWRGAQSMKDSK